MEGKLQPIFIFICAGVIWAVCNHHAYREGVICWREQDVAQQTLDDITCITSHDFTSPLCLNEDMLNVAYMTYKQYVCAVCGWMIYKQPVHLVKYHLYVVKFWKYNVYAVIKVFLGICFFFFTSNVSQ